MMKEVADSFEVLHEKFPEENCDVKLYFDTDGSNNWWGVRIMNTKTMIPVFFDFTDQEVITKYLAMTVKEKITVRLLIDAIADKER